MIRLVSMRSQFHEVLKNGQADGAGFLRMELHSHDVFSTRLQQ